MSSSAHAGLRRSPPGITPSLCLAAFLTCFSPAALLTAETVLYGIAPSEGSRFALEVAKTRLMSGKKHLFLFERYKGQLTYDREAPERSEVQLVIESASLVCRDDWVKPKDLKKVQDMALNDMLAVSKHPQLRFASREIRPAEAGECKVLGDLTIRSISKPALVRVKLKREPEGRLLFEGHAIVKMKDYGLKPPSATLGMIGTKNEMEVSFTLLATPQS